MPRASRWLISLSEPPPSNRIAPWRASRPSIYRRGPGFLALFQEHHSDFPHLSQFLSFLRAHDLLPWPASLPSSSSPPLSPSRLPPRARSNVLTWSSCESDGASGRRPSVTCSTQATPTKRAACPTVASRTLRRPLRVTNSALRVAGNGTTASNAVCLSSLPSRTPLLNAVVDGNGTTMRPPAASLPNRPQLPNRRLLRTAVVTRLPATTSATSSLALMPFEL